GAGCRGAAGIGAPPATGLLDAPVLGTVAEAESGSLVIFAGGAAQLIERVLPVLAALGSVPVWCSVNTEHQTAFSGPANQDHTKCDPPGVLLVGLRPAGQLPGMPGVHQLHVQPGSFQQVVPDPPVIRGGLNHDRLDPVGDQ